MAQGTGGLGSQARKDAGAAARLVVQQRTLGYQKVDENGRELREAYVPKEITEFGAAIKPHGHRVSSGMQSKRVTTLPVVDGYGWLVRIVSRADLLKTLPYQRFPPI